MVLISENGATYEKKILSTPQDYSIGVADGIKELISACKVDVKNIMEIVHGTTIVTNACIELTGARVGLITTRGFRDVLEISRGRMPRLYDLNWTKPQPLVPRQLRFEVDERIDKDGNIIKSLDEKEAIKVIDKLLKEKVESIAVCLYNSPKNSVHEDTIKKIIGKKAPNICISISTEVMPVIKEYERTCETVVNAYVMPLVSNYMRILRDRLKAIKIEAPLFIMQSNGGMISLESSIKKPIEIVECGPAGGVVGAAYLAKKMGFKNLITFDLGGTTCKASIVENGQFTLSDEYEVGAGIHMSSRLRKGNGYVLRVPSIDIAEIGAGGGSIIWIDSGGLLRVGPKSSGSNPGPASYDLGGTEPTLTDCYVALGYLNPDFLLGGDFRLNSDKALKAINQKMAGPLGLNTCEAAFAAFRIANSNMVRAIKAVSSERGRDPRKFILTVFGGAGALHGVAIAKDLGIKEVLIVPYGGVFSAFGFLCADIKKQYIRAFSSILDKNSLKKANNIFDEMIKEAMSLSIEWGYGGDNVKINKFLDLRYIQQGFEILIPYTDKLEDKSGITHLKEEFDSNHKKTYGHFFPNMPLEIRNLRLEAVLETKKPSVQKILIKNQKSNKMPCKRTAYFGKDYGYIDTPVYSSGDLSDKRIKGPGLIEKYDTTIVVPPDCKVEKNDWNLIKIQVL